MTSLTGEGRGRRFLCAKTPKANHSCQGEAGSVRKGSGRPESTSLFSLRLPRFAWQNVSHGGREGRALLSAPLMTTIRAVVVEIAARSGNWDSRAGLSPPAIRRTVRPIPVAIRYVEKRSLPNAPTWQRGEASRGSFGAPARVTYTPMPGSEVLISQNAPLNFQPYQHRMAYCRIVRSVTQCSRFVSRAPQCIENLKKILAPKLARLLKVHLQPAEAADSDSARLEQTLLR